MISFKIIDPDDLDYKEYLNLQRTAFDELLQNARVSNDYLNEDYFQWKYHTPAGKAVIAIVRNDNRILACNAMFPLVIKNKNLEVRGWQSCDTATLPNMRGKGYFSNCINMLSDYLKPDDIFFGFPNKNSMHGFEKLGWISKGIITTWINPIALFSKDSFNKIHEISIFDSLHDSFINNINDNYVKILKDSKYLNWRYVQNPVFKYHIFIYHDQGQQQGYIIIRTADVLGYKITIVMELCTISPKIGITLLRYVAQWAKKSSRRTIILLDNTFSFKTAFLTGFLPVWSMLLKKKQILMCKPMLENRMGKIINKKWQVQIGDWDGF